MFCRTLLVIVALMCSICLLTAAIEYDSDGDVIMEDVVTDETGNNDAGLDLNALGSGVGSDWSAIEPGSRLDLNP